MTFLPGCIFFLTYGTNPLIISIYVMFRSGVSWSWILDYQIIYLFSYVISKVVLPASFSFRIFPFNCITNRFNASLVCRVVFYPNMFLKFLVLFASSNFKTCSWIWNLKYINLDSLPISTDCIPTTTTSKAFPIRWNGLHGSSNGIMSYHKSCVKTNYLNSNLSY